MTAAMLLTTLAVFFAVQAVLMVAILAGPTWRTLRDAREWRRRAEECERTRARFNEIVAEEFGEEVGR